LFCFARRNSAGGNAGAGLKVKIGIFVKKSSDFVQKAPPVEKRGCWLARYAGLPANFRRKIEFFVFVLQNKKPEVDFSLFYFPCLILIYLLSLY